MGFWHLQRVPEPEEMDSPDEVASYSSAAAERHLDAIDDTFVEHLMRLVPHELLSDTSAAGGLDVGSGPAQIPIKILRRVPKLRFVALDHFPNMLACARQNALRAGVSDRLSLLLADGQLLPFPDHSFSFVICNSVLHHAREPVALLREIFRVATRGGVVLIRDLRRPSRVFLGWHLWQHGRCYRGPMRRLFNDSVRASYTVGELSRMLSLVGADGASVFRYRRSHLGIQRPARSLSGWNRDQSSLG